RGRPRGPRADVGAAAGGGLGAPSPPDRRRRRRRRARGRSRGRPSGGAPVHPTPGGRPIPPPDADERTMLEAWLDFHRATLVLKCSGLKDEQLRRPAAAPSSMTLLGLVQHMAEVERNWFQRVFAGLTLPPVYGESNPDGFTVHPDRGLDEATATW